MLFRGYRFWIVTWAGSGAVDEDFLADPGANAAGDDRDFIHVGARLRDALLRPRCGSGISIHAYGMDVSILRDVSGMAGSGADRKRYVSQCFVRELAENYFTATGDRPCADVRG